jgi:hypothetical protein
MFSMSAARNLGRRARCRDADEGVRVTATTVGNDLTEDGLRLAGSVPLREGRPDPVAVTALMCVLTDSSLTCRSEYTRHGRRFATLRTELARPDGRLAGIATGLWSSVE